MPNFFNKYPYTDFHELNLDWVLETVKNTVAEWEAYHTQLDGEWSDMQEDWTTTKDAWISLKNYVEHYFETLDLQEEVNTKINQMAADGTLDAILLPYFNQYESTINIAITNQNERLAVLEARMDEFASLPPGSTSGNAELLDIRVGADGTTYNSAGDAVRAQYGILDDRIDEISDCVNLFHVADYADNGITIENKGNGCIEINGTATDAINISIDTLTGDYTAAYIAIDGTVSASSGLALYADSNRWVNYQNSEVTFSLSSANVYLTISNGTVFDRHVCRFIINTGNSISDYRGIDLTAIDKSVRYYDDINKADISQLIKDIGTNEKELFDADLMTNNTTVLHGGARRWFDGFFISQLIEVIPETTLNYNVTGFHSNAYTLDSISFYDENLTYLDGIYKGPIGNSAVLISGSVTVPAGAKFMTVLGTPAQFTSESIIVEASGLMRDYTDGIPLKVGFIGDSLTQGLYSGPPMVFVNKPFPTIAKELLMKHNYNVTMKNFGRRGLSAVRYWNDVIPPDGGYHSPGAGEPGDTFEIDSSFDMILIMLGTNGHLDVNTIAQDTDIQPGQTYYDYADTQCGDYCKIIEYVMEHTNNHAQIILISPIYAPAPSHVNKMINTLPTIQAMGERYQLPVINAVFESGLGAFNASVFYNPDDLVHLNQQGYEKLGTFIGSQINSLYSTFTL